MGIQRRSDEGAAGPPIAPEDPSWYLAEDIHPVYRWLRSNSPVHEYAPGSWVVSRYDDIRHVSRSPELFCSRRGVLVNDPIRTGAVHSETPSIVYMDPPVHRRYRKLVSRAFTPRAVRSLEPRIRQLTEEVFAELGADDTVDLVEQIAVPVPLLMIADLLGVPGEDREQFRRWSDATIEAADGADETTAARVSELAAYLYAQIADHRRHPREDLLSDLVAAEIDGRALSDDELFVYCMTLLVAGNETTRNLISCAALELARHPDQRARLAREPSMMADGVEELLRWVTPVRSFARTATTDVEIAGTPVGEGDYVVMLYSSGNRDEAVFGPTAGRLDVARPTDPAHLAFGFGEHLCLGASLARLEARVVLEELLARFPDYEVVGEPLRLRSTLIEGLVEMQVEPGPARE